MRIWSVDPGFLDPKGLVACWRETLLARKVLKGETRGYRNHPQLERFKILPDPLCFLDWYLQTLFEESLRRGYHFDESKFLKRENREKIPLNQDQLQWEWNHLGEKLQLRDPLFYQKWQQKKTALANPVFKLQEGPVESWEKGVGSHL